MATTKSSTTAKKTGAAGGAKTAAKPASAKAGAKAAGAKAAVTADQAGVEDQTVAETAPASNELRLRDLIDKVATRTGTKKPQARPVIEAVLEELGAALAAGQGLNLPGLGKARVARAADTPAGAMTVKLRRPQPGAEKPKQADAQPLADPGEGG